MLFLKKDLPFAKVGVEVFRERSNKKGEYFYTYYLSETGGFIGNDKLCDMSEWVEEVKSAADLHQKNQDFRINALNVRIVELEAKINKLEKLQHDLYVGKIYK